MIVLENINLPLSTDFFMEKGTLFFQNADICRLNGTLFPQNADFCGVKMDPYFTKC